MPAGTESTSDGTDGDETDSDGTDDDGVPDGLFDALEDSRQRAILRSVIECDGRMTVSELAESVVEFERKGEGGGSERRETGSVPTAARTGATGRRSVPTGVFLAVSVNGIVAIVGSRFDVPILESVASPTWATATFGLLFALSLYQHLVA
ncbi:hypothetical protein [Halegenticoccus soli]|uniref:hypothetical protein n=1 Tax=Halegenticoccus soli TaxID=1985678 RepID=UPI000C6ECEAB|nr:hypothetical protein [Halegenticoccus soli]